MVNNEIKIYRDYGKTKYTRIVIDIATALKMMFNKTNPKVKAFKEWDINNKKLIITFKEVK